MKILVIAAHGDDAEFSMGGTIAKLSRAGHEVKIIVAIIPCENINGIAFEESKKSRWAQCEKATKILGADLDILDLDPYQMWFRRDIVKILDARTREFSPDIIFTHWDHDSHQDHVALANATIAVTRRNNISLVMYEQAISGGTTPYCFNPNLFISISTEMDVKLKSARVYQPLESEGRHWLKAIKGVAAFRGNQIGVEYAEAFQVVKMFFDVGNGSIVLCRS
jgi:LmbE family N-acetylglucosaminyl deacetylase